MPDVTPEDIRIAQVLTGFFMAAFLLVGVVPALRRYTVRLRLALLAAYVLGAAAFIGTVMVR